MTPIQLNIGGGRSLSIGAIGLFAKLGRTVVAGDQRAGPLAPILARERIGREDGLQAQERTELLGRARQEITISLHESARVLLIPKDRSGVDHADRVGPEQEAGHDAEISAAASEPPQEIRVLRLTGGDETPVRQHHIGLDQAVDSQAIFAGEVACPAAESQTGNASRGDDPGRDR